MERKSALHPEHSSQWLEEQMHEQRSLEIDTCGYLREW